MMTRQQLMDAIDEIGNSTGEWQLIEEVVDRHGASQDDSDPDEGYYVTMSLRDLQAAYDELVDRLSTSERSNPEAKYQALMSRPSDQLNLYDQGWIDGYEAALGM